LIGGRGWEAQARGPLGPLGLETVEKRLPNLIIAGVSKGGSTALAGYLCQHPDICEARSQEVFYALAGGALEDELLLYLRGFRHWRAERYLCEHSATYFFGGQKIIKAIQTTRPDARIVISVRDPVERLWSAFNYKKSKFRLERHMSFEEFLSESESRLKGDPDIISDHVWRDFAAGFYDETIVPWLDAFGDRIRVVFFEQWTRNPATVLGELCYWLEVAPDPVRDFDYSVSNRTVLHRIRAMKKASYELNRRLQPVLTKAPRLKERLRRAYYAVNADNVSEQMQPETRALLCETYRASNAALARALRMRGYEDLPAWLCDLAG
jgi:hypothetical protein